VPGSIETGAAGINNSREVVGTYYEGSSYNGFICNNGVYTTLDFPGSTNTSLSGINNSGEIIGGYNNGSGPEADAFTYSNGVFTALDLPNGPWSINDSGQIIGGQYPPYLYSDGVFTTLVPPGQINYITAVAINNSGEVIGNYSVKFSTSSFGYSYIGGSYKTIDFPGSSTTFVTGINDAGDIVGYYYAAGEYGPYGFLYSDDSYTTIEVPGNSIYGQTIPTDINDSGEIVGFYVDGTSNSALGFILNDGVYTTLYGGMLDTQPFSVTASGEILGNSFGTIIPEPSTWAMMLLGFAGIGFVGYRTRKAVCFTG
jgi:probable HAF family extracellular repeat protein